MLNKKDFCYGCEKAYLENCVCEEPCTEKKNYDKGMKDAIEEFSSWLIKYKVIPDGAMQELVRDFNGEMSKEN